MNKLLFASMSFFALLFSACERDADVDLPETKPKLVLIGFITPQDSFISISLSRSKPIFQAYDVNTNDAVTDATVTIFGNNTSTVLPFDATLQVYRISTTQFQIMAGNEYRVTVSTPQGERVEATTAVPQNSVDASYALTATDSIEIYGPGLYTVQAKFQYQFTDNAQETNRYRFYVALVLVNTLSKDTSVSRLTSDFFNDNNGNGQLLSRNIEGYWANYDSNSTDTAYAYDCWMFNVNSDYDSYHKSLYNYNGGGDPFAEPTLIYSNVTDGLGVFAAANGKKIRVIR
ncbi:MAG: DUF4249 domain-containing protein [Bacteroidia bacterium]